MHLSVTQGGSKGNKTVGFACHKNNSGWEEGIAPVVEHSECQVLHDGLCLMGMLSIIKSECQQPKIFMVS